MFSLNKKGYTLIELVVFIVVAGIILPASYVAFLSAFNQFSTPDYAIKARFYADRKISEFTRYPYTHSSLSVVDETAYDRIPNSDYNGDEVYYYWKWKIKYIDPDNIDPDTGTFKELPNDNIPMPNYKSITVTIKVPDATEYVVPAMIVNRPK
ncbi:MAG: hypothetical protein A4E57_01796 [Syntrophorhabdaceae bacterium PtaU1.Bin034]|nr:MAG: hypothetical protein A4E57_01796 [Syntrophorhabdaceae bacterium PtaU1.Bin034]